MSELARTPGVSRRRLLGACGVMAAGVAIDQLRGVAAANRLTDHPEIEVHPNPDVLRTILVAGGLANDGIAVARAMSHVLQPLGTVVGIRYAQTNVRPEPLRGALEDAFLTYNLVGQPTSAYLGSIAAIVMARPLRWLAEKEFTTPDTMILDSSPAKAGDIKGIQGLAMRLGLDRFRYSRVLNAATRLMAEQLMPPASDRDPSTPEILAAAHRRAIVTADTITTAPQAQSLRQFRMEPDLMAGLAERFVFLHAPTDPLVHLETSFEGWRVGCDTIENVIDPHRPEVSHAAAPTYPRGVGLVLQGQM